MSFQKNYQMLSIGELSALTGVHIKSLRYYGRLGILPPAYTDSETGYRYYSPAQADLVFAIQLCVEMGIPLKRFSDFWLEQTQQVDYNKLLAEGTRLMQEKIDAMQERLRFAYETEAEIARCELCRSQKEAISFALPSKSCLLVPYEGRQTEAGYVVLRNRLMMQCRKKQIPVGYEAGLLTVFQAEGSRQFLFLDLAVGAEKQAERLGIPLLCLPQTEYLCKMTKQEGIGEAKDHFAAFFAQHKDALVLQTELFTSIYPPAAPLYELRCAVLPKNLKNTKFYLDRKENIF